MTKTPYTAADNELLDLLVQCCNEDVNFLENRLIELIECNREELVETYLG